MLGPRALGPLVLAAMLGCSSERARDGSGGGGRSSGGSGGQTGGSAGSSAGGTGGSAGGVGGAGPSGGTTAGGTAGSGASGGTSGSAAGGAAGSAAAGSGGAGGSDPTCSGDAESSGGEGDGSDVPAAPSCDGLPEMCGPCQDENCCTSLLVTGGSFLRSYDGGEYMEQTWPATVSDFRLDRFEVTVGRFRPFVAAVVGGWRPPAGSGKHTHLGGGIVGEPGWSEDWNDWLPDRMDEWNDDYHLACDAELSTWTPEPGGNENHAITCVTWVEAYAFCIWDGGFLPTEAEWNYAAAGGDEQREYPWGGDDPTPDRAVYYCRSGGTPGCAWPVGSRPDGDGRFGQADLAGNRWEWVLDNANMLSVSWGTCAAGMPCTEYPTESCDDCGYFQVTFEHITRGGSNTDATKNLRAALRSSSDTYVAANDVGLRCAREP